MPGDRSDSSDSEDIEYEACDGLFACEWACCDDVTCVDCCDDRCCDICTKCTEGCGLCGDFLSAVYGLLHMLVNFEAHRAWLYGNDVDPNANGRLPYVSAYISPETEHYIMVMFSVLMSVADTGSDVYVIHKWLTYQPNEWEALVLIIFCLMSWTTSAWLRLQWIPEGDLDEDDIGGSCCTRWCKSSTLFHLIGLGVPAEGIKALGDYDGIQDNYRNVTPFKWVEILFESGPSALLAIYVISKGSINAEDAGTTDILAELVSAGISLFFVAWGTAASFTQEIPRGKDVTEIGENGPFRLIFSIALILCDLVFRMFLLTMWVNYGNVLGIHQTWLKFIIGMGGVWVFEMMMVSMTGMIAAWWQIPVQAWTQIFQGGLGFFSRSWPREDKANRGHKRNIMVFTLRYLANWGVFLWIYFVLSKQGGSYIRQEWTTVLLIFASIEPLFFMWKPPTITVREAFPFINEVTENGWNAGRKSYLRRRTTPKIQMSTVPAGGRHGRVNYGNQSAQTPTRANTSANYSSDSDFV